MARMEMYSLRVSRDQKAAWDAYATKLGIETSVLVRKSVDYAVTVPPELARVKEEASDAPD